MACSPRRVAPMPTRLIAEPCRRVGLSRAQAERPHLACMCRFGASIGTAQSCGCAWSARARQPVPEGRRTAAALQLSCPDDNDTSSCLSRLDLARQVACCSVASSSSWVPGPGCQSRARLPELLAHAGLGQPALAALRAPRCVQPQPPGQPRVLVRPERAQEAGSDAEQGEVQRHAGPVLCSTAAFSGRAEGSQLAWPARLRRRWQDPPGR